MNLIASALIFCCGIIIGLTLYPLTRLINLDEINWLLDKLAGIIAAPFTPLIRLFRRKTTPLQQQNGLMAVTPEITLREQQISESAQIIRKILFSVAKAIQRTDKVASDSSLALDSIKGSFDNLDLTEAHQVLMHEIDRVIASNTNLKVELACSQEILAEQKQQIENLRNAVRIDSLSQLANRAYFDEKLSEMLSIHKRYNETFSLMLIDLDRFKDINDSYGHPAGDRILKGVAFKIRESVRSSDFVARFGGDEFALILMKANAQIAYDVGWKLCAGLRESRFLLDDIPVTVTLSIGIAEADIHDTEESLLKRADEALYRVKHTGRNNVLVADEPCESNAGSGGQAAR